MLKFIRITISLLLLFIIMLPATLVAVFYDSFIGEAVLERDKWTYKCTNAVDTLSRWAKGEISIIQAMWEK